MARKYAKQRKNDITCPNGRPDLTNRKTSSSCLALLLVSLKTLLNGAQIQTRVFPLSELLSVGRGRCGCFPPPVSFVKRYNIFILKAVRVWNMDAQQPEESADRFSFDVPPQTIYDFGSDTLDNADEWFDQKETSQEMEQLVTPLRVLKPFDGMHSEDLPKAVVTPMVHETNATASSDVPETASSNIVTSWGGNRPAGAPGQKTIAQPRRILKRPVVKDQPRALSPPPAVKKRRSSTGPRLARRSGAATRHSVRLKNKPPGPSAAASASSVSASQHKSTEQKELERIEALQKEVAEQRKRNEASYKAALAGSQPPKKQTLSSTIPKEFNFHSDNRLKNHTDVSEASYKEFDFTTQLRSNSSQTVKVPKGTTIPKPFNLSAGHKRKLEENNTYVPMAEQIEQFQKRTPTRYHLRSRQSQEKGPSPVKKLEKTKITHPHTPQLLTRQRSRPVAVKSAAEIEAEEVEKLQQFKFKALELNRKILDGCLAMKKPAPKEATRPEGFQFEVEKRLQERSTTKKIEQEDHTFHSKPVPTRILEEVVGVPEKKVLNPTVPESPAFALKNRLRVARKMEEVKAPAPRKAVPVPHFVPFHPKPAAKHHTEVCPFSFEQRDQERQAQKEKRLDELRNEEVPKFKSKPLPDFHEVHLPEKKVTEPTKPAPFKLMVDERGSVKSERWEQMVKEELKQQAEAACFKARPNTIVHKEPFVPKKENRSILANTTNSAVAEGFQLATERRAKERQEFEHTLKEKEALRTEMEERRAREEEEREKEEIARLRQAQEYKAQPIRRYKPVELKHSEMSLTVPMSPNFSDRFRL
ncbi:Targeting protein for Xklp2-B [Bagarius yarrelli]|uniref:Targeting protein for Xklp2-B n=1 Tax=Bagarius yarrelli TaxID=175774 RepID=A0A556UYS1_BAGYA|nr:Targeting protein for Xklp2-B [Bagarius yarrelli]